MGFGDPVAPGVRRPVGPVPRPFGVSFLVVLCDIGALLLLLSVVPLFVGIPISLGILVVGHFLWNGSNWARVTFMVVLGLVVMLWVLGLLLVLGKGGYVPLCLLGLAPGMAVCGLFIAILNGDGAREYCTR